MVSLSRLTSERSSSILHSGKMDAREARMTQLKQLTRIVIMNLGGRTNLTNDEIYEEVDEALSLLQRWEERDEYLRIDLMDNVSEQLDAEGRLA